MLDRPEITILVYPFDRTILDPFVQGLRMITNPIFFFNGGYESINTSIHCLCRLWPLLLGRLLPLREQTESLQTFGDWFSCRHCADLSDPVIFDDHVWVALRR